MTRRNARRRSAAMMTVRLSAWGALAAGSLLGAAGTATAAEPGQHELLDKLQALQAQVDELRAAKAAATTAYSARDVDSAIDSVLRDADRRSQMLAESGGFYGGYIDDKFTIRSADGNYSLSPSVQFQFRSVTNFNEDGGGGGDDNTDNGFEVRRLKFGIDGNFLSKNLYYNFVWATDRTSGNLVNEEAYVRYKFADTWYLKAGQYKELIYQESQVSSKRLLAVDRTLAAQVFFSGDAYSQGVELDYDDNNAIQASIAFTDGYNSFNTNFQDPPTNAFDWGAHARLQYKVFGDWKSYSDMSALNNKKDLLVIGAGGDWSQNGDIDVLRHAVDAQWEVGPFALFGAYVGRFTRNAAADDFYDWGVVAQGAYMINSQWEAFVRYDFVGLDEDSVAAGSEDSFHEFTIGLNYYMKGHSAKITLDFGWLPNGSPSNQTGIGVLANDGEDQFYIRGQFQLLI